MRRYNTQEIKPMYTIKSVKLIESKRYKPMYIRPLELNVGHNDMDAISHIVERTVNSASPNSLEGMLSKHNPNILEASANVLGEARIANGWDEKRFKVVIILEVRHPGSDVVFINYIQGYTDYMGVSMQGSLDPDMIIHINSVTVLRKTHDVNTGIVSTVPYDSFNIVHDDIAPIPNYNGHVNALKTARPDDVLAAMTTLSSPTEALQFSSNVGSIEDIQIVNKNTITPTSHVSKTISSAVNSALMGNSFTEGNDIMETMVGDLLSPAPGQIEFLKILANIKGRTVNTFTLNDLNFIDNNPSRDIDVFLNDDMSTGMTLPKELLTNDTADTYDTSYETRLSTIIHESVSTLLNDSLLSEITFSISNEMGKTIMTPLHMSSYIEGLNLPMYTNQFMSSFINKAWPTISNNNMSSVTLLVNAMVESETTMSLKTDGRHECVYRYPTFANSKFIPLIVDDGRLDMLAEGYNGIVGTAIETTTNTMARNSRSNIQY